MKLLQWEDSIDVVECGETYTFGGVKVSIFDDSKFLHTKQSTMIDTSAEEIQDINLTSREIEDSMVEGHCVGVICKRAKSCVVCSGTQW